MKETEEDGVRESSVVEREMEEIRRELRKLRVEMSKGLKEVRERLRCLEMRLERWETEEGKWDQEEEEKREGEKRRSGQGERRGSEGEEERRLNGDKWEKGGKGTRTREEERAGKKRGRSGRRYWRLVAGGAQRQRGEEKDNAKQTVAEENEEDQRLDEESREDDAAAELSDPLGNLVAGLSRDLERIRHENEVMRRQLEEVRLERSRTARSMPAAIPGNNGAVGAVGAVTMPRPAITALGELLSEFSGAEDTFGNWRKQLELVRGTYNLDDNCTRILIGMKLKQKALKWFHAKPENLEIPVAELIDLMEKMFDYRPARIKLRRKFEKRRWRSDESFSEYYYNKVILASRLSVDDDELIDCIIDGIPEIPLRNQARMHRFETKENLLRAFKQIKLRPENKIRLGRHGEKPGDKVEEKTPLKSKEVEQRRVSRCYNCNKEGHMARECDKTKRERDSCYECGATDHVMRDCKKKKQTTTLTTAATNPKEVQGEISNVIVPREYDNEYRRRVEVQISASELECRFITDSQLDTACPVSLIKARFIPPSLITRIKNEHYEGINGSALEVQGTVKAKICVENAIAESVTLRVVPERTKCDVLLGRDALKNLGLTIIKRSREREVEDAANEILNIDVNELVSDEIGKLDINPDVSYPVRCRVIESFQYHYLQAERPVEPKIKAELKLNIKDKQPFHHAPSRLAVGEKGKLREILDDLLKRGIIRPSVSEYASRTVLVRKKDGNTRLCIDFCALNKIMAQENYPLPVIEEQIEALEGKKYFTFLDLKEGFHHVNVHEDSIKYTAFITAFGQFEYVKMPFGLKNASARFQRYVNKIFEPLIRAGLVLVYIDDFLIATETVEEHIEILERVFKILVENKLELRQNKCKFFYEKIEFLGYVISNSIQPNEAGITAVKNFPTPTCIRDV
ncbi:uncharacterized protein LOC105830451 [Monomorium pharaonis]|uniref:uncharacterized protein LOC105830451 n=1 Tax=Monomorium pharaonis TaxID=307658 RepID=UPI001746D0BA|nr:uncharacterized protein LOC105830451 [Monomorium pharaonis]